MQKVFLHEFTPGSPIVSCSQGFRAHAAHLNVVSITQSYSCPRWSPLLSAV